MLGHKETLGLVVVLDWTDDRPRLGLLLRKVLVLLLRLLHGKLLMLEKTVRHALPLGCVRRR